MAEEGPSDSNSTEQKYAVADDISQYVQTIDSLKRSLSLSMYTISRVHKHAHKKLNDFVAKNCAIKKEGDREVVIVPIEHDAGYRLFSSRHKETQIAAEVVPRSFVVALVSEYDAFLGKLLASLFQLRPELLSASERTLTFSKLSEFASIEDARSYVLEKEVESFLRQSHAEQFKWLENKFDVPLRKDLPAWAPFIEITERRNLFVHAGGVVSNEYLQNCRENGVKNDGEVKIGSILEAPWKYYIHAHAIFFEIGVKLGQVLWRKLRPEEIEAADLALNSLTYDLLASGSYGLAKVLLDFALLTLKKHAERDRLVFLINRAQAYKWSGDQETAAKMLSETDWSATAESFQLAHYVLLDDFKTAAKIMTAIGPKGFPHKVHYRDWPLFKEFRKSPEFRGAYEQVFGETAFESDSNAALERQWYEKDDPEPDREELPPAPPPSIN